MNARSAGRVTDQHLFRGFSRPLQTFGPGLTGEVRSVDPQSLDPAADVGVVAPDLHQTQVSNGSGERHGVRDKNGPAEPCLWTTEEPGPGTAAGSEEPGALRPVATDENLTTPGPDRLIAPGKHRDLTTSSEATVTGPPPPGATPKDAMRHRLRTEEGSAAYKRRSATVEPVFAHLKELLELTRFSRRGLPAAAAELHLTATVHNIRRMHTW